MKALDIYSDAVEDIVLAGRRQWIGMMLISYAAYALLMLAWVTEGFKHFNYTLDDPYIHLQLAKNIWNGHYGFNSTELSAPSSSIIWPFLLAPFSRLGSFENLPLILNLTICLAAALLLFQIFERKGWSLRISAFFSVLTLLLVNSMGLALNGLEHVLQLLVVLLLLRFLPPFSKEESEASDWKYIVLIGLGLMVRYELLAFWAAFVGYFILRKEYRRALIVGLISLLPMLLFSIFLKSLGLGWLPDSVVAKTAGKSSFLANILGNTWENLNSRAGMVLLVLTAVAVFLSTYKKQWKVEKLWILVIPPLLHMIVGKFGWFFRYEIYVFLYIGVLLFLELPVVKFKEQKVKFILWSLFFVIAFWPYAASVGKLRQACRNIYYQQGVTLDFVNRFLAEPIGVNDIGLVGFKYHHYILDLWGLASKEALSLRLNSSDFGWVTELAKKHDVQILIVYEKWIQPPAEWIKVADFEITERAVVVGDKTVSVFMLPSRAADLREKIRAYSEAIVDQPVRIRVY